MMETERPSYWVYLYDTVLCFGFENFGAKKFCIKNARVKVDEIDSWKIFLGYHLWRTADVKPDYLSELQQKQQNLIRKIFFVKKIMTDYSFSKLNIIP